MIEKKFQTPTDCQKLSRPVPKLFGSNKNNFFHR